MVSKNVSGHFRREEGISSTVVFIAYYPFRFRPVDVVLLVDEQESAVRRDIKRILISFGIERVPEADAFGPCPITINPMSPDGYYASGSTVSLEATPNEGYFFSGWNGMLLGSVSSQILTMSSPADVTAGFLSKQHKHQRHGLDQDWICGCRGAFR